MITNSARRAATCAGPTSDAAATACNGVTPERSKSVGSCDAIAPVTNQAAAKTKARSSISLRGCQPTTAPPSRDTCAGCDGTGSKNRLSGKPAIRLSAAQTSTVSRQPKSLLRKVEIGQLTVEAKPANNVMPV